MSEFSVHDQDGFQRVYDEDDMVSVRRGDLRALLDVATGSMDFGSGFLDNEQVEVLRKIAEQLGIDPVLATPYNFTYEYVCLAKQSHDWQSVDWASSQVKWVCKACRHTSTEKEPPTDATR